MLHHRYSVGVLKAFQNSKVSIRTRITKVLTECVTTGTLTYIDICYKARCKMILKFL